MHPKVSIIIPIFNSAKYLAQAIESGLGQTWDNKEIIIVDDGSEDDSLQIAKMFTNETVKILEQHNQGAGAARNAGINLAEGDYIQFLDADDILSPNKLSIQVEELIKYPNKLAVCSTIHFIDGENHLHNKPSPYEEKFLVSTDNSFEFLINLWGGNNGKGSMIQTNAWLTPTTLIRSNKPWQEFYSPDDDGEYFSRMLLSSAGVVYTTGCYNYYRKHKSAFNLSRRDNIKSLQGCFQSIKCKRETLNKYLDDPRVKKALAQQLFDLVLKAYPRHKQLATELMREIQTIGGSYEIPPLGGNLINLLSKTIGWKKARLIQNSLAKVLK